MRQPLNFLFVFTMLMIANSLQAQDMVSFEIVDEDGTSKTIEFEWPYKGPPPIGSSKSVMNAINDKLSAHGIDCPPERQKISEYIWKCGNGKKIRTNDKRLARLLTVEWDK